MSFQDFQRLLEDTPQHRVIFDKRGERPTKEGIWKTALLFVSHVAFINKAVFFKDMIWIVWRLRIVATF